MSTNPPPGGGDENAWNRDEQSRRHWPNDSGAQANDGWGSGPAQSNTGWGERPSTSNTGWGAPPPPPNAAPPAQGGSPQPPGHHDQGYQGQGYQGQGYQGQYPAQGQGQGSQDQFVGPDPQAQHQPPGWAAGPGQSQVSGQPYTQGMPYAQQGQSTANRPKKRGGLIALVVILVIVLGVGIGWGAATLFPRGGDDSTTVAATEEAQDDASDDGAGGDSSTSPSSEPEPSESESELPDDPKKALEQLAETDGKAVTADLDGKWVPQLSSKKTGLEAEGKTWKEKDILEEHQEMREEFPRVQLVWSGDFASFKEDDFWVTVVGIGYDDPEDALSWCSSHGLGPDSCYAKQLNTTGGYEGTTKLQD